VRIADISARADQLGRYGSQARVDGILGLLAERHEVRRFGQPRWDQLRAARAAADPAAFNTSRAAALVAQLGHSAWLNAPITAGAAARVTRPARVRDLLEWADVAMVELPWLYDHCARTAPTGLPLVLATHNAERDKFESYARALKLKLLHRPWLRYIERAERRAFQRAPLVLAVTEAERQALLARYGGDPAKVLVTPNGVDVERITPATPGRRAAARRALGLPADRPVALFIGGLMPPNAHGYRWVERLARADQRVTYVVAGRCVPAGREGNLIRLGFVEDHRLCFDAADVSLVPIEFGGGTKIKLIESLAAGLPVVSFPEGAQGLAVRDGQHLLLAGKSDGALLEATNRLIDDGELADRIGAAGRRFAEDELAWPPIVDRIERALLALADQRSGARAAPRSAVPLG
jgi:glycosyltransferase involved in cell wall biosynthesis